MILIVGTVIVGFAAMAFLIFIMNAATTDYELDYLDDIKETTHP